MPLASEHVYGRHGNVLIAIGPAQVGMLLAIPAVIELDLNIQLRMLLAAIIESDLCPASLDSFRRGAF
jgi:hypothetical protein